MAINKPGKKGEGQRTNGVGLAVLLIFLELKSKRNYTTYLTNTARREFFKEFIDNNSSNPKDLFTATKKLLKHDHGVPFPPSDNKLTLANEMVTYFIDKIRTIHAKLDKLISARIIRSFE